MGIFFTIFRHFTELWVSFSGNFSYFPELWPRFSFDLRNYDPKIHQNLRNYGYQFFGQNCTSPSDDRSRYSPPPESTTSARANNGARESVNNYAVRFMKNLSYISYSLCPQRLGKINCNTLCHIFLTQKLQITLF